MEGQFAWVAIAYIAVTVAVHIIIMDVAICIKWWYEVKCSWLIACCCRQDCSFSYSVLLPREGDSTLFVWVIQEGSLITKGKASAFASN